MSDAPVTPTSLQQQGGLQRLLLHMAWAMAAAVLVTVGWVAMRPFDPRGAMSVLEHAHPMAMMVQVAALTVVTAGLATAVAGRWFPDAGAFAVGVGLTLASFRGGDMTQLLIESSGGNGLAMRLAGESLFWSADMFLALLVSHGVGSWLFGSRADGGTSPVGMSAMSALGLLRGTKGGGLGSAERGFERMRLVKHVALSVVLGLVLIRILGAGGNDRAIRHGQACFAVVAGMYLAVGQAYVYFPNHATLSGCLAASIVGVLAFVLSWVLGLSGNDGLASVPVSAYLRILPVTYVAAGTSAALLAHWRFWQRHAEKTEG